MMEVFIYLNNRHIFLTLIMKAPLKFFSGVFFLLFYPQMLFSDNLNFDTEQVMINESFYKTSIVWNMPRQYNHVALTFDDGPDPYNTPKLLEILMEKNVKATFFLVGHMITKYPHIVKMIHDDGHHIANHTWAHYRLDEMSESQINNQLQATELALKNIGVSTVPFMRPPGGRYNNWVINAVKNHGMVMMMWDVNAADYKRADGTLPSAGTIVRRVMRSVRPGSIILLHNSDSTVKALPILIDRLKQRHYTVGYIQ